MKSRTKIANHEKIALKSDPKAYIRSKKSVGIGSKIKIDAKATRIDCFSEFLSRNSACGVEFSPPNLIDPNSGVGDFFKWLFTPASSEGGYASCINSSLKDMLDCFSQSVRPIVCIYNYSDSDNRKHVFPCDQDCTMNLEDTAKIFGCDGIDPNDNATRIPENNMSKGKVTTCKTSHELWCQCPTNSKWNETEKRCKCNDPTHVPYYGAKRGDNTFEIGYCGPNCGTGKIWDIDQNECIAKPEWY